MCILMFVKVPLKTHALSFYNPELTIELFYLSVLTIHLTDTFTQFLLQIIVFMVHFSELIDHFGVLCFLFL